MTTAGFQVEADSGRWNDSLRVYTEGSLEAPEPWVAWRHENKEISNTAIDH